MDGQYDNPLRIAVFNTAEGWSRDVTKDVADELRRRLVEYDEVPALVRAFVVTTGQGALSLEITERSGAPFQTA